MPTDVAAGLILVHQLQSRQPNNFRYEPIPYNGATRTSSNGGDTRDSSSNLEQTRSKATTVSGGGHTNVLVDIGGDENNTDILPELPTNTGVNTHITRQPSPTSRTNPYGITTVTTPELHSSINDNPGATTSHGEPNLNRTSTLSTSSGPCIEVEPMNIDITDGGPDIDAGARIQPQPWMSVHNAAYYMKFALATYSWPVYMYMNIMGGACSLWPKCRLELF